MKRLRHFYHNSQGLMRGKRFIFFIILLLGFNICLGIGLFVFASSQSSQPFDEDTLLQELTDKCFHRANWRDCYGYGIAEKSNEMTVGAVTAMVNRLQSADPKTRDCHVIVHRIMTEKVKRDYANWQEMLDTIDPNDCNYGYIHGILEARSSIDPEFRIDDKVVTEFCQQLAKRKQTAGIDQTCSHIMGHLVLVEQYGDIDKAVKVCGRIPEDIQRECYGGLFMENFTRDNFVIHGIGEYLPWNEDTIQRQEEICNRYSAMAGRGCWHSIGNLYTELYNNDPEKVFARCESVTPTIEYRNECYMYSITMLMNTPTPSSEFYALLCQYYHDLPGNFEECMSVAVRSVIYASVSLAERAFDYCEAIPDRYKQNCYRILGIALGSQVTPDVQEKMCNSLVPIYKASCLKRI